MNLQTVVAAVLWPLAAIAGGLAWRAHEAPPAPRFVLPPTYELHPRDVAELGGRTFALSVCRLEADAPPLPITNTLDSAVPSVAAAPDGGVYVLDAQKALRHYTRSPSKVACELVLDRAFGRDGLLDVSHAGDAPKVFVAADGAIYVSTERASWRLDGETLVPIHGGAVRATLSSRSIVMVERTGPLRYAPGGPAEPIALPVSGPCGPTHVLHSALTLLDDDDVVVLDDELRPSERDRWVQRLAIDRGNTGRRVELTGMEPGTPGCGGKPDTLLRHVSAAARIGSETWVYGGSSGERVWRFDERGMLLENPRFTTDVHGSLLGITRSAGLDGALWVGDAERTAEDEHRFIGVVQALVETTAPRGRVNGRPFVAREVLIDQHLDTWHIRLGDGRSGGLEVDIALAGGPSRSRIAFTRWEVPREYTSRMVHGLADGTLTIDVPEQDTFVSGEFADAFVDSTDELRARVDLRAF